MMQMTLFPACQSTPLTGVVNVASVPQRSPFRYPGGKTWFVPTFRNWLTYHNRKPKTLLEPFAGGGIISLTAAFESLVEHVVMVEKDPDVSSVWRTIIGKDSDWLSQRILSFNLTYETVLDELERIPKNSKERAFQTILKNRTFHGGILASGSGLLKKGENGKGVMSRWYPETLARRISDISIYAAPKISFIEGDAFDAIEEYKDHSDCVMFIDPPYTAGGKCAGKRLYNHHVLDHQKLFDSCKNTNGFFLMTYDNAIEIQEMALTRGFRYLEIPMKNTHHAKMTELIVGKACDPLFFTH